MGREALSHSSPPAQRCHKGCEEKHSHTAAHYPVVKPPAVVSTASPRRSQTPTQRVNPGET